MAIPSELREKGWRYQDLDTRSALGGGCCHRLTPFVSAVSWCMSGIREAGSVAVELVMGAGQRGRL